MVFAANFKNFRSWLIVLLSMNTFAANNVLADPPLKWPLNNNPLLRDSANLPDEVLLRNVKYFLSIGEQGQARTLLTLLLSRPKPHLEAHFLSGMLYLEQGRYLKAAVEFRNMLARDPSLVRPRLELARALYLDKDFEGARYHFEQVMAGDIPSVVRANINNFLSMIRTQVPTFNIGMDIISDSNPKQSTSDKTVNIGGRFYSLNTTAPKHPIWGIGITSSARIPFHQNPTWYVTANAELTKFRNKVNHDQLYLLGMLGKHMMLGQHTLTLESGYQLFQYQWHPLYSGLVVRLNDHFQHSYNLNFQISLEGKQQKYPKYPHLDGWIYTAGVESQHAYSPQSRWSMGANISHNKAREKAYCYQGPSTYLNFSHEWNAGLISGLTARWSMANYRDLDPFFGVKRSDRELGIELNLVYRLWQIGRLSPRLLLGVTKHDSNIALYAFTRSYVKIGMSREF